MRKNDGYIRLAFLFALGLHCLFLLIPWKFYDSPPEPEEPSPEVVVAFKASEPIPEKIEEVVEESEPVSEEVKEIIEESEPIPEEPEEVIEESEPIPEEPEEVIEEPEPIPEEPKEVIEEPEPIPEEPEEIIEEPEPIPEEPKEVIEEPELIPEEPKEVIEEPVPEKVEKVVEKSEVEPEEKTAEEPKPNVKNKETSAKDSESTSEEEQAPSENQIEKPQFPKSYFQVVIREIISAKRYPRFAQKRGIEGEVLLEFTILGNGKLKEVRVINSSGHSILDKAAVSTVKRAASFPPVPKKDEADLVTMRITIVFELESW